MIGKADARACLDGLEGAVADRIEHFAAFDEIDSTNSYLSRRAPPAAGRFAVALAGHQTAGRGRRQREWLSEPGGSLCLSIAYTFEDPPERLSSLTLALGVAVTDALAALGIDGALIKWPNDVMARDAKLGGILAEAQHRGREDMGVVAGVGLNLRFPDTLRETAAGWAQRAIDLVSVTGSPPEDRQLAIAMIEAFVAAITAFDAGGFEPILERWRERDWLCGRRVTVDGEDRAVDGIAAGVDADGALLIDHAGHVERVLAGTVIAIGDTP